MLTWPAGKRRTSRRTRCDIAMELHGQQEQPIYRYGAVLLMVRPEVLTNTTEGMTFRTGDLIPSPEIAMPLLAVLADR